MRKRQSERERLRKIECAVRERQSERDGVRDRDGVREREKVRERETE